LWGERMVAKGTETRLALIKAATILFADRGLDAVSVRDITSAARTNISAITYHFGSKDELIREVYKTSMTPRRDARLAALEEYERRVGKDGVEPEGVLRALIEATVRAAMEPKGEASYAMRLVFQAYALRRPLLDDVISQEMDGFARHFIEALGRAVPGVTPEEIGWRYYFVIGATLFTSFDSHRSSRLRRLTDGLCDTSNADRMIEQLLAFFMQGIRGRISKENLGVNRVLRISAKAASQKSKVKG
jgi:AcrR family transcriptional regulator